MDSCSSLRVIHSNLSSYIDDLRSGYKLIGREHCFEVEFDTYNNYGHEDPSDNHIGININSLRSTYTRNLCGGHTPTSCSFPWTGVTYTAWIEYDGLQQLLKVWFANTSMTDGVSKPPGSRVIKVPNFT